MDNITDNNLFIHQAIRKAGSKKALGEVLGVHRHTITKWLADVGSMPLRAFVEISKITGLVAAVKCARKL